MTSTLASGRSGRADGEWWPERARRAASGVPPADLVGPAKALRLLGLLSDGLNELHRVTLDDAARGRFVTAYRAALIEVASVVSDALIDELVTLHFRPLDSGATLDELRIAQAQLAGWVNGLLLAEANLGSSVTIDGTATDGPDRA
jgi:Bacterial proteasome activator